MFTAPECRKPLRGIVRVQGDKSISHRALIFSALASGSSRITGLLKAGDVLHTADILRALGTEILISDSRVFVRGRGFSGLSEPAGVLDVGNSGTGIRLLAGLLAGQPFVSFLTGDSSIIKRPMDRIIRPLNRMGCRIVSKSCGRAPLCVCGGGLKGIVYRMPIASAQVKSCLLLAGLFAQGRTTVIEPVPTRDHTERMMEYFGLRIRKEGLRVTIDSMRKDFPARDLKVPADISSANYFLALGLLVPKSRITVKDVGLNPLRTGLIGVLKDAGARLEVSNIRNWNNEPVGDVTAEYSPHLKPFTVGGPLVANVIDEIPVLAVLAAAIPGRSVFRDADELRHKESDRIRAVVSNLRALGVRAVESRDGFSVSGGRRLSGGIVKSHADHRIVMSFSVAASLASGRVKIDGIESVATSFPDFFRILEGLRRG